MIENLLKSELSPEQKEIMYQIGLLDQKSELQPVTAIFPNNQKIFMERIEGTTKYLCHNRKVIYDITFVKLYNMGIIPESHFVIDHFMYYIEDWSHISEHEHFNRIMNKMIPTSKGVCIYLDDKLFQENVSFLNAEKIRNELLYQRNDGTRWFDVLKIVDPSGNETIFLPSRKAKYTHSQNEFIQKSKNSKESERLIKREVRS